MNDHMKIFPNVVLIGFLGVFATGCMYPGGRPDYTGSGALSGAATGAAQSAGPGQGGRKSAGSWLQAIAKAMGEVLGQKAKCSISTMKTKTGNALCSGYDYSIYGQK